MNINGLVKSLIRKYGTKNPYTIAKEMGVTIVYEDLGTVHGYYNKQLRDKQIHINQNLSKQQMLFTMYHELGHVIMHPNVSTPFLASSTFLSVNKLEIEANTFAMYFLISDDDLKEYRDYCIPQLSMLFGYDEELISLRVNDKEGCSTWI